MSEFSWPDVLGPLAAGEDLSRSRVRAAMAEIMTGRATAAQVAAFIVSLRSKGETVEEMTGLVEAMRQAGVIVDVGVPVIDIVGTGGDGAGTFNISTAAAFIAAGAGARVAKHGNRAASSRCGSADVLEALGVVIDASADVMAELVREEGFGFFFAPKYHPAMKHAAPVRSELGIPTVFNFLGPLTNPAGATRQAIGVSDPTMAEKMIGVLNNLGSEYSFVFYGEDGLDELTSTGPSYILRLREGEITRAEFTPEDFGIARTDSEDLQGGDPQRNVEIMLCVLDGEASPHLDVALINAAAAIVVAGLAEGFVEGVDVARAAVQSGAARSVLDQVVARTQAG